MESHRGDDAVDSERGEDEEEGRAENEQLRVGCGDDTDETASAAAYSPTVVTNPLLLEASLPATSSTQGTSGLTNTSFELASLGKVTCVVLHACLPFPNILMSIVHTTWCGGSTYLYGTFSFTRIKNPVYFQKALPKTILCSLVHILPFL